MRSLIEYCHFVSFGSLSQSNCFGMPSVFVASRFAPVCPLAADPHLNANPVLIVVFVFFCCRVSWCFLVARVCASVASDVYMGQNVQCDCMRVFDMHVSRVGIVHVMRCVQCECYACDVMCMLILCT